MGQTDKHRYRYIQMDTRQLYLMPFTTLLAGHNNLTAICSMHEKGKISVEFVRFVPMKFVSHANKENRY